MNTSDQSLNAAGVMGGKPQHPQPEILVSSPSAQSEHFSPVLKLFTDEGSDRRERKRTHSEHPTPRPPAEAHDVGGSDGLHAGQALATVAVAGAIGYLLVSSIHMASTRWRA
jgi:hypothetical protein